MRVLFLSALLVAAVQAQQLHCTQGGISVSLHCSDTEVTDEKQPADYCSHSPTRTLSIDADSIKTLNHALFNFPGNCNFDEFEMMDEHVEKIEPGTFSNFPKLKKIYLNGNQIKTLSKDAFKKSDGGDMPNVKSVSLDQNGMETIEDGAFAGLTGLEDLDLANNKLTELDFGKLPNNLQLLQLQHNSLEKLKGEPGKYAVMALDIVHTNIKPAQLSVLKADALERLYISDNNFNAADLAPLANFKNLKSLNLSGNHLSDLQPAIFDNFPLLEMIDLSNTGLKNVDLAAIVANKPKLMSLFFHNNEIDKFDFSKVPSSVTEIDFSGNKFNFKCSELQKIVDDLKAKKVDVHPGLESGDATVHGMKCQK